MVWSAGLGIPTRTLRGMPDEFIDGMVKRALCSVMIFAKAGKIAGRSVDQERGQLRPNENTVHILVTLNAQMDPLTGAAVQRSPRNLGDQEARPEKRRHNSSCRHNLPGQEPPIEYQDLSAFLYRRMANTYRRRRSISASPMGLAIRFSRSISNGDEQALAVGSGALDGKGNWRPLATGEFLLGYPTRRRRPQTPQCLLIQPQRHFHGLSQAA